MPIFTLLQGKTPDDLLGSDSLFVLPNLEGSQKCRDLGHQVQGNLTQTPAAPCKNQLEQFGQFWAVRRVQKVSQVFFF